MKIFLSSVLISLFAGVFLLLMLSFFVEISEYNLISFLAGTALALVFVVAGFFTFYFAKNVKQKSFNKIVLVSMITRLVLIAAVIVMILKFLDINQLIFMISLFVWYFIFQIWEVISFNKMIAKGI